MRVEHELVVDYCPTFRTRAIAGMFDVPVTDKMRRRFEIEIDLDTPWSVGAIIGPSGSGKSTLARKLFGPHVVEPFEWNGQAVVDDFDARLETAEVASALTAVGFSSPPNWLLPYRCLSTGQQFRAQLARAMLERREGPVVFDEFTSVVDRQVAKACAVCVGKWARRHNRQFVAVTCHRDILEWLEPDWVIDTETMESWRPGQAGRGRLRRPQIQLEVQRVDHSAWAVFRPHHYLSADLNKAAVCFGTFWDSRPIGIVALLPQANVRNTWRVSRNVVLPDYQGFGFGMRAAEWVGSLMRALGYRMVSTASHPAIYAYRRRSRLWRITRPPSRLTNRVNYGARSSIARMTFTSEYVGPPMRPTPPHHGLMRAALVPRRSGEARARDRSAGGPAPQTDA